MGLSLEQSGFGGIEDREQNFLCGKMSRSHEAIHITPRRIIPRMPAEDLYSPAQMKTMDVFYKNPENSYNSINA